MNQARMGDATSHGGMIVSGAVKTMIGGQPAARMGDLHACPLHGVNPVISGSPSTLIEGMPAARMGDSTGCGAVIIAAAPTVQGG